jgi:hypothetical protein
MAVCNLTGPISIVGQNSIIVVNYDIIAFSVLTTFTFQDTNSQGIMACTITSIVPSNPLPRFGIDQSGPNTGM